MKTFAWKFLLLLLSGDVELNPGPPKRGVPGGNAPKKEEVPKENQVEKLETKVRISLLYFNFVL